MTRHFTFLSALLLAVAPLRAAVSPEEAANTIILDETGEKNLKIETVEAEETDFEETVFALGRIEPIPEKRAVVASRIQGRIVELRDLTKTLGHMNDALRSQCEPITKRRRCFFFKSFKILRVRLQNILALPDQQGRWRIRKGDLSCPAECIEYGRCSFCCPAQGAGGGSVLQRRK